MTNRKDHERFELGRRVGGEDPRKALDDELAFHLEMLTRDFMKSGMSRDAARRAAHAKLGNVDHLRAEIGPMAVEVEMDERRSEWLAALKQDVAYAVRVLARAPGYAAIAIATLAIGIGASAAIFSVVDAVVLRGLPYEHSDRLVSIGNGYRGMATYAAIAAPEFADIGEAAGSLDAVAALRPYEAPLRDDCTTQGCNAELVHGYGVSPGLFRMLGARVLRGRDFVDSDGNPASPAVVILSHDLWQRRYGGDTAVLGASLTFNGQARQVVGIMPSGVRFPDAKVSYVKDPADLWFPVSWELNRNDERGNQNLVMLGRLREGASPVELRRDLSAIETRFKSSWPDRYGDPATAWRLAAVPLTDELIGAVRAPLLYMFAAVGLVLMIACANVANLMLVRGASRANEFALRAALGAGRGRLARQLLTESVIVALAAGVVGVVAAYASVPLLLRLDPGAVPMFDAVTVDRRVMVFAVLLSLVTAILCGFAPALRQSRINLVRSVRDGTGMGAVARRGWRSAVVVMQVALATVLLVSAGLLTRSFRAMHDVPVGVQSEGRSTFKISLPRAKYDSSHKIVAFFTQLQRELVALPGVRAASAVTPLPMSGEGWSGTYHVFGQPAQRPSDMPHGEMAVALPGYMVAHGIPVLAGRDFTEADAQGAPPVVVVDERLARLHWPGQDAIGQRVSTYGEQGSWATVIGVVGHVRRRGPFADGEPQLYYPLLQRRERAVSFVVSGRPDVGADVRAILTRIDPELPTPLVEPAQAVADRAFARQRFSMVLIGVFGLIAVALVGVGLYGVMGFLVAQRTRELGVRLAVGGTPGSLLRMVFAEGLTMTVVGIASGLLISAVLARGLSGWLYGISPIDPVTYVLTPVLLGVVASVSVLLPARRATAVDPVRALRA